MARTKRAAAAKAEHKIKLNAEVLNNSATKEMPVVNEKKHPHPLKRTIGIDESFEIDSASEASDDHDGDFTTTKTTKARKKRKICRSKYFVPKQQNKIKLISARKMNVPSYQETAFSSAKPSLFSPFSIYSGSTTIIGATPGVTTADREWFLHQERCAWRQVNSTGPMRLSTNGRHLMGSQDANSPLVAMTLSFTPQRPSSHIRALFHD